MKGLYKKNKEEALKIADRIIKNTYRTLLTSCLLYTSGGRSDSGVVKALNLGKDEGTALIAQFLYEAIDENEKKEQKKKPLSLSLKRIEDKIENDYKVKQFLTFSDLSLIHIF